MQRIEYKTKFISPLSIDFGLKKIDSCSVETCSIQPLILRLNVHFD